ncbi:hypothetical protein L6452_14756 [Arctium lappa]|uniref:Uncharacterized protein n=1 Tax=Arctium lappa TaxID=4217 RepID=A0ACB9CLV1_ARCLA|nr:hypothetical protein L6452_14756 [Arctium lappa]
MDLTRVYLLNPKNPSCSLSRSPLNIHPISLYPISKWIAVIISKCCEGISLCRFLSVLDQLSISLYPSISKGKLGKQTVLKAICSGFEETFLLKLLEESPTLQNARIKSGKSHLIEDGALPWIVKNANNEASPIRRHIELALCYMAQHE